MMTDIAKAPPYPFDEEQFHRVAKFHDRGNDGVYQSILTSGGKSIFMSYQMTVTLTYQEYQTLAVEAVKRGDSPEKLCVT
jgi:hypothetical protein